MASQKFAPKVSLPMNRSPNPTTCLIPRPVRSTTPNGIRIRSAVFPQCTRQTDRPTDRPTHHSRESLTTICRYAPRVTRPKNGHGHRQLWTKYIVHIMVHKNVCIHSGNCRKCTENWKHDKYSDINGKHKSNSSNNRRTSLY